MQSGIVNGPCLMIQTLNERMRSVLDRPIRAVVDPAALCVDGRFTIGVDDDLQASLTETFRKMSHKQFSSTVICRRDGNERWRNEGDFQFTIPMREMNGRCLRL